MEDHRINCLPVLVSAPGSATNSVVVTIFPNRERLPPLESETSTAHRVEPTGTVARSFLKSLSFLRLCLIRTKNESSIDVNSSELQ